MTSSVFSNHLLLVNSLISVALFITEKCVRYWKGNLPILINDENISFMAWTRTHGLSIDQIPSYIQKSYASLKLLYPLKKTSYNFKCFSHKIIMCKSPPYLIHIQFNNKLGLEIIYYWREFEISTYIFLNHPLCKSFIILCFFNKRVYRIVYQLLKLVLNYL